MRQLSNDRHPVEIFASDSVRQDALVLELPMSVAARCHELRKDNFKYKFARALLVSSRQLRCPCRCTLAPLRLAFSRGLSCAAKGPTPLASGRCCCAE